MKKRILNIIICLTLAMFLVMGIGCNEAVKFQPTSTGQSSELETDDAGSSDDEQKTNGEQNVSATIGEGFVTSSYETLNGVDTCYEIAISSVTDFENKVLNEYIVVYNQLEEIVDLQYRSEEGIYYFYEEGGFKAGFTYSVELLSDSLIFVDDRFSGKRSMSFTVSAPETVEVEERKDIRVIENFPLVSYQPDTTLTVNASEDYGIKVGEIVKFAVLFYEFKVQRVFVALSVEKMDNGKVQMQFREAAIKEIYDKINISTATPITADNTYVRYRNDPIPEDIPDDAVQIVLEEEEDIASDLENSEYVQSVVEQLNARKGGDVKIETVFELKTVTVDGLECAQIICDTNFVLPLISKDKNIPVNFNVDLNITFTIGIPNAVINPLNKAFGFTVRTMTETKVKFALTYKQSLGSIGKLDNIISENGGLDEFNEFISNLPPSFSQLPEATKDLQAKLSKSYVPVAGGVFGVVVELRIAIKVEVKAEISLEITNTCNREFGVNKEQGLKFFNNVIQDETIAKASLEGELNIKAGPVIGLYASAAGILSAGIELGAGAYIKAAGIFSVQFSSDMNESAAFAGYVELGLYLDVSGIVKVDLGLWTGSLKINVLPEKEQPFLQWGLTKQVTLHPHSNSLIYDGQNNIKVPDIDVVVKDLLTHEQTVATIEAEDFNDKFEIIGPSNNILIDSLGNVELKSGAAEEFVDEIKIRLKNYEQYFGEPPALHTFYVGINPEEYLVTSFKVTKDPIAIDSLTLEYEQVLDDPGYSQVSGIDAPYFSRHIDDFQIGRLVRVVPKFVPSTASYKTLNYHIDKGAEYIQDFRTYDVNGVTYAEFRVKDNAEYIGKAVKISATSNGYMGEYADYNISGTSEDDLIITEVPAMDFEMGIFENGEWTTVNSAPWLVYAGETIVFDFVPDLIVPTNATTTLPVGHILSRFDEIYVESGAAEIVQGNLYRSIHIKDEAEKGDQIVIVAKIGDLEKKYYLGVIAVSAESIILNGGETAINAGSTRTIQVTLTSSVGEPSGQVTYHVLEGKDICSVVKYYNDPKKIDLIVSPFAKQGDCIKLVAAIDGLISNVLEYTVSPVTVSQVVLQINEDINEQSIERGQEIQLSAQVMPENATYDHVVYKIIEENSTLRDGKFIGDLDEITGFLKINYLGRYPDQLTVAAEVNGVQSNSITFSFEKVEVTDIRFVPNITQMYVYPGDVIALDAAVNEDASVQDVEYFMHYGEELAVLEGNILTVADDVFEGYGNIGITVYSVDNPDIKTYLNVVIMGSMFQVRVNGKTEEVDVLSTDELVVTAVDSMGNPISLEEIDFNIYNENWEPTVLLTIENGKIVFPEDFYIIEFQCFNLECIYQNEVSYVFLNVVSAPSWIDLWVDETASSVRAGNEVTFKFDKNASYIGYADSLCVEVVSGNATIVDKDTIYIDPYAQPGEKITVRAKWDDDKGHAVYSDELILTIQSGIDSIEIVNMKEFLMLGETYQFVAQYFPSNRANISVKYYLSSSTDSEYVDLDEDTGIIFVKDQERAAKVTVKVWCSTGQIRSPYYEITLLDYAQEIHYRLLSDALLSNYNEEKDIYLLERESQLQFEAIPLDKNGYVCSFETVRWYLSGENSQFVNLAEDGTITVKESAPDNSFEVILFAGTENVVGDPIRIVISKGISTADDFMKIRENYYGYYILKNDIDFNYEGGEHTLFTPFPVFYGVLEGNGYQIKNVMFDTFSSAKDYGLIIENHGVIQNVVLTTTISFYDDPGKEIRYVGGFSAVNYGVIRDCSISSFGYFFVDNEGSYVGGIVGMNAGLITGCSNYVTIFGNKFVGGVAGYNQGRIEYSVNARNIIVREASEPSETSGVVGFNEGEVFSCGHMESIFVGIHDYTISEYEDAEENSDS